MQNRQNSLAPLLRKLELHAYLPEGDRQAVLALPRAIRTLEAQTHIIREGDSPTSCAILLSGFAYRHKITAEGSRQIVGINIPGEPLDFQNMFLGVADHNVQTLTRVEIASIPYGELDKLARERPDVAHAILVATLIEASIFREWVLNVGRRDARTRLAHLLCELAVRLEAQGLTEEYGYELPMTQEQLADTTGLTSVHVNRTLKLLEAEGLIVRNRRNVAFPDWKRMREVGDFNQRYLHLERQPSRLAA